MNTLFSISRTLGQSVQRSTRTALIATVALPALAIASPAALPAFAQEQTTQTAAPSLAEQRTISAEVRATLSQYGSFVVHQKYGEVWMPTTTPQAWHPYPACNWKNDAKLGWFYDDQSAWGRIVHHYGRWAHDDQGGWMWVPGSQFSPGWVAWRTSTDWVGWAPLPPDSDMQSAQAADFEKADLWTFIDAKKFAEGCTTTAVAAPPQIVPILEQTTFVRQFAVVDGILVAVLPKWIVGPVVHINIGFAPWPAWFFNQTLWAWNWFWNNVKVTINVINLPCPPQHAGALPPPNAPAANNPPKDQPPGNFIPAVVNFVPLPILPPAVREPQPSPCPPGLMARGNFCVPGDQARLPRPNNVGPGGVPPKVVELPPAEGRPPGLRPVRIGPNVVRCNTRCNPHPPVVVVRPSFDLVRPVRQPRDITQWRPQRPQMVAPVQMRPMRPVVRPMPTTARFVQPMRQPAAFRAPAQQMRGASVQRQPRQSGTFIR